MPSDCIATQDAEAFPGLTRIALYGGGRWARTLLVVLRRLTPTNVEILWITKHLAEQAKVRLQKGDLPHVRVMEDLELGKIEERGDPGCNAKVDAAIVATSPARHFRLTHELISRGIPTLCEKPIATTLEELEGLLQASHQNECPCGLHLELMYLESAQRFRQLLGNTCVRSLEVIWHDPWLEMRNDEIKSSEVHTDIVSDQLPHCWSLIANILGTNDMMVIDSLRINGPITELTGRLAEVSWSVQLSRRWQKRVRRILVNGGEAEFDFTQEPGNARMGTEMIIMPEPSQRPLTGSINEFLRIASRYSIGDRSFLYWPMAIQGLQNHLRQLIAGRLLYLSRLDQAIQDKHSRDEFDPENLGHAALIVDRALPEVVANGRWCKPIGPAEQIAFAKEWLSDLRPPADGQHSSS